MAVIYVGCALSRAPQEFKNEVKKLKEILSQDGHIILEFVIDLNVTDDGVYQNDVHCISSCDIFLAITDFPSTGLGLEIGLALERFHKPILCVYRNWDERSRMVHGLVCDPRYGKLNEIITFAQYENLKEIATTILPDFLRRIDVARELYDIPTKK